MVKFFVENWGNLASVVGLVFSILGVYFARRASRAAEAARDSVLQRTLSQDVADASRVAANMTQFARLDRGEMTLLLAEELQNQTSYCLARWEERLAERSRINLGIAKSELSSICKELSRRKIEEMSAAQKSRLARACQTVNTIFREESGTAMKATDKVE